MHVRAPRGSRLEETEKVVARVEQAIREVIPANELRTINATIGLPFSLNLAFVPSDNISGMNAELLVSLHKGHKPTVGYQRLIRQKLSEGFPGTVFYFQTADIVSQVLNFGLSAPIDIQIQDQNFPRAYATAQRILNAIQKVPGVVDSRIIQIMDFPTLQIDVDRQRAARLGVAQRDVANNMLTSLAGSALVGPTYYLNPQSGVNYIVAVQTPLDKIASVSDVLALPANPAAPNINPNIAPTTPMTQMTSPVTRISDIASVRPTSTMQSISHYTVQRVVDVAANIDGRDLGSASAEIKRIIAEVQKNLPSTVKIFLRGQNEVMETSFRNLGFGLILAIILVYAVLVVLFQSWVDPFIIMMAVPGALIGILWMLAGTGTTINVASLMGAIMSVGIAVSNSILVVSFANDLRSRNESLTPFEAVIEAAQDPAPPDPDDRARHDHRHGPDGARARRGRRAERAARPRGDRRPAVRHLRHVAPGADLLHAAAAPVADPAHARQALRGGSRGRLDRRFRPCLRFKQAPETNRADHRAPARARSTRSGSRSWCLPAPRSAISMSAATTVSQSRRETRAAAVDRGPRVEVVAARQGAGPPHHYAARRRALERRPRPSTARSAAT